MASTLRPIRNGLMATLIVVGAWAALGATSASAIVGFCEQMRASGNRCTEYSYGGYHGWLELDTITNASHYEVCAKAETAPPALSQRSGSPAACANYTSRSRRCLSGPTPASQAYGYFGGYPSPDMIYFRAVSPADTSYC